MKIIYQAFDGTQFPTPEECEKYESFNAYQAWNFRGEKLPHDFPNADDVAVVYFPNEEATDDFFNHVGRLGEIKTLLRGIERDDYGLFSWDFCTEQYIWIDPDNYKSLMAALTFLEGRKKESKTKS